MVTFFVRYTCPDRESRDGFYAALRAEQIPALCEAEDGCLKYEYFCPCEAENELFLLELWRDRAAQKLHTTQPHFARIGQLKALFGAESALESYELKEKLRCPVCGEYEFTEPFEICPVCGWENDRVQQSDSDFRGGANRMSLSEARALWQERKDK